VSTIKKCEDDESVIVRLYDIEGRDTEVDLNTAFALAKAEQVNIIEEEGRPLPCGTKSLKIKLGHQSIETLKLWPKK